MTKIKGEAIAQMNGESPLSSYTLFRVRLVGGPCADMQTVAGNTEVVYCHGHRYRLNARGEFVYESPAERSPSPVSLR
jgi:hypothetical protein